MKILIINPNTSVEMSKAVEKSVRKYARKDVELSVVNPQLGPISIDNRFDRSLTMPGVLGEVKKGLKQNFDGIIIAAACDPGLYAARELAEIPVIGAGEASMLMACTLGHKFSILTLLSRFKGEMEEIVKIYGLQDRCASIRPTNVPALASKKAKQALIKAGRKAIEEDGAEVLCLGCVGMAGLDEELSRALKVPVIDPTVAALKLIEALIDWGKKTSKIETFKPPAKKEIKGYPSLRF